jgi:hypothetical protein
LSSCLFPIQTGRCGSTAGQVGFDLAADYAPDFRVIQLTFVFA